MSKVKRTDKRRVGTPTQRALARMLGGLPSGAPIPHMDLVLASPDITAEAWTSSTVEDVNGVTVETSTDGYPQLETLPYLAERLEVNLLLTAWLQREGVRDQGPWWENMRTWADKRHTGTGGEYWSRTDFNTSNMDTLLIDDVEGVTFVHESGLPMVALRASDGGRGRPYVFEVTSDEPHDLYDWDQWTFTHSVPVTNGSELPGMPLPPGAWKSADDDVWHVTHAWDKEGGAGDAWIEYDGAFVRLSDYGTEHTDGDSLIWERRDGGPWRPRCPIDGTPCEIYAPQTW